MSLIRQLPLLLVTVVEQGMHDKREAHDYTCTFSRSNDKLILTMKPPPASGTMGLERIEVMIPDLEEAIQEASDVPPPKSPGYDKPEGTEFRKCSDRYSHGPHAHGHDDRWYCTGRSFDAT